MLKFFNLLVQRYSTISCNMSTQESYIRFALAVALMLSSVKVESYLLLIVALVIFSTAFTKFCLVYQLLNFNKKYSLINYYLSQLPKYDPAAVLMCDKKGKIFFKNRVAEKLFDDLKTIDMFQIAAIEELIAHDNNDTVFYEDQDHSYQIFCQGMAKIESLLIYISDISEIQALHKEIEETQESLIFQLGEMGEMRSKETGYHVKRVAEYSKLLGALYGLSYEEIKTLTIASPMHDIGKIAIPDAILLKPGKLTPEEFQIMKDHTNYGYNLLKASSRSIIRAAATIAYTHHEKFDGTGYPRGLRGDTIPLFGRITAIADVFDALMSKRVYKTAWSSHDVKTHFIEQKGQHFDPELTDLFLENFDKFLAIFERFKDKEEATVAPVVIHHKPEIPTPAPAPIQQPEPVVVSVTCQKVRRVKTA